MVHVQQFRGAQASPALPLCLPHLHRAVPRELWARWPRLEKTEADPQMMLGGTGSASPSSPTALLHWTASESLASPASLGSGETNKGSMSPLPGAPGGCQEPSSFPIPLKPGARRLFCHTGEQASSQCAPDLTLPAQAQVWDQYPEKWVVQWKPEGQWLPPRLGRHTSWLQIPAVLPASL